MSSKNNPGPFNCYAAAYPDETIFTVLARDPAMPATIRFWAGERARIGKDKTPDDIARIEAAYGEATLAEAWRELHLDPVGDGVPAWRLPRHFVDDDTSRPIRMEAARDPVGVQEAMAVLRSLIETDRRDDALTMVDRIIRAVDDIEPILITRLLDGTCQPPEQPPFSASRLVEDDESDEFAAIFESPGFPVCSIREGMVVGGTRDGAYAQAIRLTALLNAGAGQAGVPTMPEVENDLDPLTPGERAIINSQPDNLAHAPEVPPHRFSILTKGERYAYARGLEVAPMHLPRALDNMALDGWYLIAIFGQTDSEHIGFIFERRPELVISTRIPGFTDPDVALRRMLGDDDPAWLNRAREAVGKLAMPEGVDAEIEVHVSVVEARFGPLLADLVKERLKGAASGWAGQRVRFLGLIEGQTERAFDLLCGPGEGCPEFGRQQEP